MPGARCARKPRVQEVVGVSIRVSQVTPESPGIPRAVVLTGSFALSSAIGLFCHRHRRRLSCRLDASVEASGPHDFSVRLGAVRQKRRRVHRIPPQRS